MRMEQRKPIKTTEKMKDDVTDWKTYTAKEDEHENIEGRRKGVDKPIVQ